MVYSDSQDGITCRQAQLLMALHMKDDPDLTQAQREAFEAHTVVCSAWRRANVREGIRANVMFILLRLGVLIVGYSAVESEYMGNFLRRRLATFKLAVAALFASLGAMVIGTA